MAEITFGGVGSASVASGVVTEATTLTIPAGGTITTRTMDVAQLPHLFVWAQTAAVGVNISPQFAVRDQFAAKAFDWHDLSPPIPLAAGVGTIQEYRFPARAMQMVITGPAGADVSFAIGAASGV